MARIRTILVSTTIALTLVAGIAFAQRDLTVPRRADPELSAAQQSLYSAMDHLQKARNSEDAPNVRARAYIALAQTELETERGGGVQGLQLGH
jgi:hypothetical protein